MELRMFSKVPMGKFGSDESDEKVRVVPASRKNIGIKIRGKKDRSLRKGAVSGFPVIINFLTRLEEERPTFAYLGLCLRPLMYASM